MKITASKLMVSPLQRERSLALRAEHESRLRRKTASDGLLRGLADGQVNKFPVSRQCLATRFAPFALPDTKSLTASRKRPLGGLHEKCGYRCSKLRPSDFVFRAERRSSMENEIQLLFLGQLTNSELFNSSTFQLFNLSCPRPQKVN